MRQRKRFLRAEALEGCSAGLIGTLRGLRDHAHFWLLELREIDLKGSPQRFQRLDTGALSSFEALNRAHTQPAQFGQLLLRPASLQPELLNQHGQYLRRRPDTCAETGPTDHANNP